MKYDKSLAIKLNMSQSERMRAFRHTDLDMKLEAGQKKYIESYKPFLDYVKEHVTEQWAHLKPHINSIPESIIKSHSDTLAQSMIFSELLARKHTRRQHKLNLSNVLYQNEIEGLLNRKVITMEEYELLKSYEKLLAFSMAKVQDTELLETMRNSLALAINKGQGFSAWKTGIDDYFDAAGVTRLNGYYLQNVFRTNTFSAYLQGRWRSIYADLDSIAFIRVIALPTACEEICIEMNGYMAPPTDESWNEYSPIYHYNCRCDLEVIYSDSIGDAKKSTKPKVNAMSGFGSRSLNNVIPNDIMQRAKDAGIVIDFRRLHKLLDELNGFSTGRI